MTTEKKLPRLMSVKFCPGCGGWVKDSTAYINGYYEFIPSMKFSSDDGGYINKSCGRCGCHWKEMTAEQTKAEEALDPPTPKKRKLNLFRWT